jgi:ribosomal 50S subunit-associated protein YjgA (DUF615 family)
VLLLATIARIESRWAPAVELYREYLELAPSGSRVEDAMYHRIECMRRGKIAGIEAEIDAFIARFPKSARAAEVAKWRR